jgi:hypothetical protein
MKKAIDYWTPAHSRLAASEGWDVFTRVDCDLLEIQVIAEWYGPTGDAKDPVEPAFAGDREALDHVYARAAQGSALHMLATHLDRRPCNNETYVPEAWLAPTATPQLDGARASEVGSIYCEPSDRFVVSLITTYGNPADGIATPEEAAGAALDLTRDDGSAGTNWHVFDRKTGQHTRVEQSDAEAAGRYGD